MSSDGSPTLGQDRGEHWSSSAQNSQLCLLPQSLEQTAFLGALPPNISTVPRSPFFHEVDPFSLFRDSRGQGSKEYVHLPRGKISGWEKSLTAFSGILRVLKICVNE